MNHKYSVDHVLDTLTLNSDGSLGGYIDSALFFVRIHGNVYVSSIFENGTIYETSNKSHFKAVSDCLTQYYQEN